MKRLIAALLAAGLLGGCGQPAQQTQAGAPEPAVSAAGEPSEPSSADGDMSAQSGAKAPGAAMNEGSASGPRMRQDGLVGRVAAVEGTALTLELYGPGGGRPQGAPAEDGGRRAGGMPGKEGGPKGAGGRPDAAPSGETPPQPPEGAPESGGETPPQLPEGTPPDGGISGGEAVTVAIPDGCGITLADGTAATLAELAAGDTVRVVYGEDGETPVSVEVLPERDGAQPAALAEGQAAAE